MSGAVAGRPDREVRGRPTVLVVDDEPAHRQLLAEWLRRAGMPIRTAATAEEALEHLDGVDLVLLDHRLPGLSGLEAVARIRERPRAPAVILVTGEGSAEIAAAAMRAGAIDYVTKHRDYLETLPAVVERAWQTHDLQVRAAELQRLALLVASMTDRDQLAHEIVVGAARLVHADTCALLVVEADSLEPAASLGPHPPDLEDAIRTAHRELLEDGQQRPRGGRVFVPLPSKGGEPLGVLALWSDGGFTTDELGLAEVFASFAGIALGNLRQFEFERQLATELQRSLDARRDLVAAVSHELRAPLTAIVGFTSTLRSRWADLDDARREQLFERVARNAEDMGRLVDELLDLAALERGRAIELERRPVELAGHVRETVERLGGALRDHEVVLDLVETSVLADPALLRRALNNLLTNAAKFSAPGTAIEVRTVLEDDRVHVEVVDRGVGLDAGEAARVFEPFYRAPSTEGTAVHGSGIGLALVREYVRAMGGEVTLRSRRGEGSAFGFSLQRASDPPPAARDPGDAGARGAASSSGPSAGGERELP